MQTKVQSKAFATRTDRQTADDRNTITTVVMVQQGCLPARRPRAPHRRYQHEPGFVDKDEVGAQPRGFFNTRPFLALPATDFRLVAFQRAPLRLLARELKFVQQSRHVTTMETHLATLLDQLGYARGRPQLGGKTLGHRTLQQILHHPLSLRLAQCRRPTGREPHFQCPGAALATRFSLNQRITELAAHPTKRAASFSEHPLSTNRNA